MADDTYIVYHSSFLIGLVDDIERLLLFLVDVARSISLAIPVHAPCIWTNYAETHSITRIYIHPTVDQQNHDLPTDEFKFKCNTLKDDSIDRRTVLIESIIDAMYRAANIAETERSKQHKECKIREK